MESNLAQSCSALKRESFGSLFGNNPQLRRLLVVGRFHIAALRGGRVGFTSSLGPEQGSVVEGGR